MIDNLLDENIESVGDYTELRAQINTDYGISIVAGNLVGNSRVTTSGVSARVYNNGFYGFASNGEYNEATVKAVLKAAKSNADFLNSRAKKHKPMLYDSPACEYKTDIQFIDVPQKIMLDFAREIDSYIENKYKDLQSRSVVIRFDSAEKLLAVSNGTRAHTLSPRCAVYVVMSAEATDGTTVELFEVIKCKRGFFTEVFSDASELYEKIDNLYNMLMQKREGVFSEAGVCDCIIDSAISGMIAHEAIGHTVEADLVLAGSVAANKIGEKVAADNITIIDFANTAFGEEAPLPVYIDDEGVECKDAVLIKDGILTGYMNNKESAVHFGVEPCGNARAYGFNDEPLIRMRNTAILPGKDKLEDMIASIDNGYYLTKTQNGQADTTGEFMFGITMGYEIKNGKLGRAIRDTTISGVAFDMLKSVDMLSDNVGWALSGYCGKKQPMAVSDGGPAVKCKINIGGR